MIFKVLKLCKSFTDCYEIQNTLRLVMKAQVFVILSIGLSFNLHKNNGWSLIEIQFFVYLFQWKLNIKM